MINNKKFICIFIQLIIVMLLAIIFNFTDVNFSTIYMWNIISILLFIWSFYSWVIIQGTVINIYTIFLVFCYIFNFAQIIIYCFNLTDNIYINKIFQLYSKESIINSTIFAIFCLAFLHLGALIFGKKNIRIDLYKINDYKLEKCHTAGVIIFLICIVPTIVFDGSYIINNLKYGYLSIFSLSVNYGLWDDLSRMMKTAIILLIISNIKKESKFNFWFYLGVIYSIIKIALIGQRGYELAFIITLFWLKITFYNFKAKKLDVLKYGISAIIFLKIMYIISEVRGMSLKYLTVDIIVEKFLDNSFIINQFSELGSSLGTICAFFEKVPLYVPHGYGISYIKSLLLFLPNLSFISDSIYIGNNPVFYISQYYEALGGSIFGELYYNFGWNGCILAILPGILIAILSTKLSYNPIFITFCSLILCMLLWLIRDTFSYIPRYALFNIIIPFIVYKIIKPINFKL